MVIKNRKIKLSNHCKFDVILISSINSNISTSVVDNSFSILIYNEINADIFLNYKIFKYFFKNLFKNNLLEIIDNRKGILFGFMKYLYLTYTQSLFLHINPKFVLTYIDNDGLFGWLSKNTKEIPFIGIQNGARLSYAAVPKSGYHCQYLFCFGSHEKKLFKHIGYDVKKFYPSGSLAASLYFSKNHVNEDYDILIISTWRGNIGFQKDVQDTMRSMRIMDKLLANYIKSNSLKVAIILRSEEDSTHFFMPEIGTTELEYYKNIYKDSADIFLNNFEERPIYNLIQRSKMIISCLSSALLEGFGIGKKALYYNFCNTNEYHKDFNPLIVSSQSDQYLFNLELDQILNMPEEVYKKKYAYLQKYYMSFPLNFKTSDYIKKEINLILNNHSRNVI